MPRAYDRAPTQARTARRCGHNDSVPSPEPYDAGPVAALRRIAFLLERSRAETYKVKAFRSAAATILPLTADELETRVAEGTLKQLSGIGSSTAAVIAD